MHFIRQAEYIGEYKVRLVFEDGSTRVADLSCHLDGEIFEPLKNIDYFRTLRLEHDLDTIVWDNGADMSPDFLYEISEKASEAA